MSTRAAILLGCSACLLPALTARAASGPHALLDVPYFSQTPELCGAAATAMVMRYWGDDDVYPDDFRPLVVPAAHGIPATALVGALRSRGWSALEPEGAGPSRLDAVAAAVDRGRPVIALIQVGPNLRHYVVIVGVTADQVVLHDPARTPFVVVSRTAFDAEWAPAERWALIAVPPAGMHAATHTRVAIPMPVAATPVAPSPCDALVARGVDTATGGDLTAAGNTLESATTLCPGDGAALRELAGLRFLQRRFDESRDLAARAVALSPDDANAWRILATSRYLEGDVAGALDAWNHVEAPRLDIIDIETNGTTRRPVIARLIDLEPRAIITASAFGRAERRLSELPSASQTSLRLEPIPDDRARVTAEVLARTAVPDRPVPLAALAARAIVLDEATVDISDVVKSGDRWTPMWRWAEGRPQVSLDLAVPSPAPLPGLASLRVSWDRQSYATPGSGVTQQTERGARFSMADWASATTRWEIGGGLARDDVAGRAGVLGSVEERLMSDRLSARLTAAWWTPVGSASASSFTSGDVSLHWRSSATALPTWSAASGIAAVTAGAPLAFWPGAGTGVGRDDLLRAHPLVGADGVIDGPAFGQRLSYATVECERPVARTLAGPIAIAAFIDAAKAWRRLLDPSPSPWLVDAGVGLRVHAPGVAGVIRVDVAHGLRDGAYAVSAGWTLPWPR